MLALRQGDTLSPYLFIILAEMRGRLITTRKTPGKIHGLNITTQMDSVTHQQFVDDTIVFRLTVHEKAKQFKQVLELYESNTGQEVKKAKSKCHFFNLPC